MCCKKYKICTEYYSVIDDRIVSIYIYIYIYISKCIVMEEDNQGGGAMDLGAMPVE
jgi:hypothetical protein